MSDDLYERLSRFYILNDAGEPVPATLHEWAAWLETHNQERQVALSQVGEKRVSTVFLGMNLAGYDDRPLYYETMVFDANGNDCGPTSRYTTKAEAFKGHHAIVSALRDERR